MPATSPSTAPTKAVSPRHAVLEELIALALRHVADDFRDVCTALAGLLVDGSQLAGAPAAVRASLRAGNLMRDRHFALLHRTSGALERALRQELAQLAPQAPTPPAPAQPLSLVPYEEMDQRLTLGDAARPFEAAHADALAALNVRVAHLLERAVPRLNPFRPEVFIAALQEAWTGFDTEEGSAALLLPLVKPGRFFDLGRLYGALNLALERNGVLPGPLHRQRLGAGHDGRRHDALAGQLRRFLGADEGVPADAGQAGRADGRLLAYLAGLPHPVATGAANAPSFHLGAIKRDAPAGSLSRADEGAIDLLAAVFDTVARDAAIAPESRDLLHGLQLPVLKAALADKAFFFEDAHPARRLLDLLAQLGWERSQRGEGGARGDDLEYQAMRRSALHAAHESTEADEVTAAFAHAVRELEAALQAEEEAATAAIAAPIAAALKQEKTLAARRAARDAVALRLGGGDVVAVVGAFLDDKWTDVLTVAYSIDDDKPGAVRHATQAMDDLLWSVRPKIDAQERKQLIARLPGLLAALNKWLDVIKWQDAERLRFFADLADCHASIVRAPLDIAPERRVELSVQAASAALERRQARAVVTGADDGADDAALAALARGAWLDFAEPAGPPRRVKLAWISPMRSLFIFSNGARQEAFSLAAGELARRLGDGTATVLRHDGVVVRALAQALAGNDAAPGRDAA